MVKNQLFQPRMFIPSTCTNYSIYVLFHLYAVRYSNNLKGKFPQTTMWIGRVESNFRNPTVKFGANLNNPFKRTIYAKLCMSPSLDGTMPESVISQEYNSPLTLYIEFHNLYCFLDINSPVDQVQSYACTIILVLTYLSTCIKVVGRCIFMKSENFVIFVYSSIRQLYCCDITDN